MKNYYLKLIATTLLVFALHGLAIAQVPTVSTFSPASGPVGTAVTITGTNFDTTPANNIVFFGATQATVSAATATSLTVTVPTGATYQPITVLVDGLMAYASSPFVVTFTGGGTIDATSFEAKVDYTSGAQPYSVSIGDLDGDGKPDLAMVNRSINTVSIFLNTSTAVGTINYAAAVEFTTGDYPYCVSIGDLDGDGKADLAVANLNSNSVSIFRNTSTGAGTINYAAKVDFTTGTQPYSVSLGDLDGDGKADLTVANSGSATVSVFRNTSTGVGTISYADKLDYTTGTTPQSISIGDLDGDGKPDLAVTNRVSATVSIFRNTSTGVGTISYATKLDYTTGTNPWSVSIGDLDGDGKVDLAVTNYSSATVSIFRNTSTGVGTISYATKLDYTTGTGSGSISIGDLDGDGNADLAVLNYESNTVSIFRNTNTSAGTISFATKVDYTTGTGPQSVSIGDLDGDGKPDLAVTNYNSSTVSVFRNSIETASSIETEVTSFSLTAQTGAATIDATNHTVDIEVANGTVVTGLIPTFELSTGATATVSAAAQVSGTTANDFTSAVTYTVTAEDGSTTQDWTVTVSVHDGLIAQYDFTGDATDSSDNGLDATLGDGATATTFPTLSVDRDGVASQAYSFDGGDHMIVPHDDLLNFGTDKDFTFTGWFKTSVTGMILDTYGSNASGCYIYLTSGTLRFVVFGSGSNVLITSTTTSLFDDAWHHYAVSVKRDVGIKLYIDGVLDIENTTLTNTLDVTNTVDMSIGGYTASDVNTLSNYFTGSLDEIRIYNTALTVEEIEVLAGVTLSTETDITSFTIPDQKSGLINSVDHVIDIVMPKGTAVTALVPTITLSTGATVSPLSGVAQDFTNQFDYTVTGEDAVTTQVWAVNVVVEEDLFAHYEFTGTLEDSGNLGNDGLFGDGATSTTFPTFDTDRFGVVDMALYFDGDAYARIDYKTTMTLSTDVDLTVTGWFSTTNSTESTLFDKSSGASGFKSILNTDGSIFFYLADGTGSVSITSTTGWNDGTWHQYAVTVDRDGGLWLYIDGALDAEQAWGSTTINPDTGEDLLIGVRADAGNTNLSNYFVGYQDEVQLYTKAFTAQEISDLYNDESGAVSIETDFTTFSLTDQTGAATINTTDHTVAIEVVNGTTVTALVPTFTVSAGATVTISAVAQESGVTSNNFTSAITYTVTAEDGVTTQDWVVTVVSNAAPVVANAIADQMMILEDTIQLDIANVFLDAEGDALSYVVSSNDASIVSANVSGQELSLVALGLGGVEITLTASDGSETVSDVFTITVENESNAAPVVANAIADQMMILEGTIQLDIANVFLDAEGDTLSYVVSSTDASIVSANVSGQELSLVALGLGEVEITLTASDGNDTVSDVFTVTVENEQDGLISHYQLNNNTNDDSGNNYHASLIGGASFDEEALLIGDNLVDGMVIPNGTIDGLNDFTISTFGKIVAVQNEDSSFPQNTLFSGANASDDNAFTLMYDGPNGNWKVGINNVYYDLGSSLIEDLAWHHIVLKRLGAQVSFYIDGGLVNSISATEDALSIDATGFVLGQEQDVLGGGFGAGQSWNGYIKDFGIYNTALSDAKIVDLSILSDLTEIESFSFEDQTGDALIDLENYLVTVEVGYGTSVSDLIATYALSSGATARVSITDQTSGVSGNDYASSVVFTVIAEDGVTTQDWTVIVVVAEPVYYNIASGDFTASNTPGAFVDSGDESGNYLDNESYDITIYPATNGEKVKLEFLEFSTENGVDVLDIYDGDEFIGQFSGSAIPETIIAENAEGTLRIVFSSDGSITDIGFLAIVSSVVDGATLSNTVVNENNELSDVVGTFSTESTYRFVLGTGSEDNGSFIIDSDGLSLLAGEIFDYEVKSSYFIRVSNTLNEEFELVITIENVNEAPVITNLSYPDSFNPNSGGSFVVSFDIYDPEGDAFDAYIVYFGAASDESVEPIVDDLTYNGGINYSYVFDGGYFDELGLVIGVGAYDEELDSDTGILTIATETTDGQLVIPVGTGELEEHYRMIAYPYELVPTSSVFDDFGDYDNARWRLFNWNGNSYTENPSSFEAGKGYWFINTSLSELYLPATSTVQLNTNGEFELTLRAGYNQIGNPFPYILDWGYVQSYNEMEYGITVGEIITYQSGYSSDNTLQKYEGAFLNQLTAGTIYIPVGSITNARTMGATESRSQGELDSNNWEFGLDMSSGSLQYSVTTVGMNDEASDGIDAFDIYALPRFEKFLDATLGEGLTKGVVTPSSEHSWDISVNSTTGEPVTMRWDNEMIQQTTFGLYMMDVERNTLIDLSESSTYTFSSAEVSSVFTLYYGDKKTIKSSIVFDSDRIGAPYPNPSNGIVTVPVMTRSTTSDVNITVLNVSGKVVKKWSWVELSTGYHELNLDVIEKDIQPGTYILKLDIEGDSNALTDYKRIIIEN
ncbi:MAG: FG-GAP-like repeat-containing protein [Reichenbachiella sp.]